MVLAAGHGDRLQPLTAFLPKPLLPIRGRAVVARTLEQLAAFGCEAAALNLFHLGEAIREHLGESFDGMPLSYSAEERLLGTWGALAPLRGFVAPAELLLIVNGDSLCRWPLRAMVRRHLRSRAEATLLVSRRLAVEPFGGGIAVAARRRVVAMGGRARGAQGVRQRVFMGAHLLNPRLVQRAPRRPADFVSELYIPMLEQGARISALETSRKWHDLGTPERYRSGALDWGRRRGWVAGDAQVAKGARLERSVIESSVRVERGAHLTRSVVLPRARVGRACRVVESIIGPGVELPDHTSVEGRMVTTVRADAAASRAASVVGGLVYEPI